MSKRYCVLKNTLSIISDGNSTDEQFLADALSSGLTVNEVEILTQQQYSERKESQPEKQKKISDNQRIENLEHVINMIILGGI